MSDQNVASSFGTPLKPERCPPIPKELLLYLSYLFPPPPDGWDLNYRGTAKVLDFLKSEYEKQSGEKLETHYVFRRYSRSSGAGKAP